MQRENWVLRQECPVLRGFYDYSVERKRGARRRAPSDGKGWRKYTPGKILLECISDGRKREREEASRKSANREGTTELTSFAITSLGFLHLFYSIFLLPSSVRADHSLVYSSLIFCYCSTRARELESSFAKSHASSMYSYCTFFKILFFVHAHSAVLLVQIYRHFCWNLCASFIERNLTYYGQYMWSHSS